LYAGELDRNLLDRVDIPGDHDNVMLTAIAEEAVLTALARENAKIGLIPLEMRCAAKDLHRVVG